MKTQLISQGYMPVYRGKLEFTKDEAERTIELLKKDNSIEDLKIVQENQSYIVLRKRKTSLDLEIEGFTRYEVIDTYAIPLRINSEFYGVVAKNIVKGLEQKGYLIQTKPQKIIDEKIPVQIYIKLGWLQ